MWVIVDGKEVYIEKSRILDPAAETVSYFDDDGNMKIAVRRDPIISATIANQSLLPVFGIAAAAVLAYMFLK